MRLARRVALTALVLTTTTTVIAAGGPAFAAPPGNDTYAGRAVVRSVPFAEDLDTGEATTDADDAAIGKVGGARITDASVWYELTLASDTGVLLFVPPGDYPPSVIVATGSPGSWKLVSCTGWDNITFPATAGTQYTIFVFDAQSDPRRRANGGDLHIEILPAPDRKIKVNEIC